MLWFWRLEFVWCPFTISKYLMNVPKVQFWGIYGVSVLCKCVGALTFFLLCSSDIRWGSYGIKWQWWPRVECHFDIIAQKFRFPHLSYMLGWHYESHFVTLKMLHLHVCWVSYCSMVSQEKFLKKFGWSHNRRPRAAVKGRLWVITGPMCDMLGRLWQYCFP